MYVGPFEDGSGAHCLVFAALNEAITECLAGYATEITVIINGDGSCTVDENGRGIICATDHRGRSHSPDVVLTQLHVIDAARSETEAWERSPIGLCPVNALSEWLEARLWRDGQEWSMKFAAGVSVTSWALAGPAPIIDGEPRRGSAITFLPSRNVFPATEWDAARIEEWVRAETNRFPSVTIRVCDARPG